MKIKLQFLDYSTIMISIICIAMVLQSINSDFLPHYRCAFLLLIPIITFILLNVFSKTRKWKNTTNNIIALVLLVITFFFLLLIEFYVLIGIQLFRVAPIEPPATRYEIALKKLKNKEWANALNHFPGVLPENIKNYFFQVEISFDGYDTHYVKFDTDRAYIDNVLKEYKNKCEILTTKDKIDSYNIRFYIDELKKADRICVLHKSKPEKRYTSGISVYDKTNTIYFFYANF